MHVLWIANHSGEKMSEEQFASELILKFSIKEVNWPSKLLMFTCFISYIRNRGYHDHVIKTARYLPKSLSPFIKSASNYFQGKWSVTVFTFHKKLKFWPYWKLIWKLRNISFSMYFGQNLGIFTHKILVFS